MNAASCLTGVCWSANRGREEVREWRLASDRRSALMASASRIRKWVIIAVLPLMVATLSGGSPTESEAPSRLSRQAHSVTVRSDSAAQVEVGARSAAPGSWPRSDFEERFVLASFQKEEPESAPRLSFNERFAAAFDRYDQDDQGPAYATASAADPELADGPRAERLMTKPARIVVAPNVAPHDMGLVQEPGGRTAIYDISAHSVYLPSGQTLEAHSGLGGGLDEPRYILVKGE